MENFEKDLAIADVVHAGNNLQMVVESLQVHNTETQIQAADVRKEIKTHIKTIEERRKFYTAPMNEVIKAINGQAKKFSAPLEKMSGDIDGKLTAYHTELERQRREEEACRFAEEERLRKEREAAKTFAEVDKADAAMQAVQAAPVTQVDKTVHGDNGGITYRKVWTFDIVDLEKVPHEYFTFDEKKVNAAIRAGVRDIPGLRIFQRTNVAGR